MTNHYPTPSTARHSRSRRPRHLRLLQPLLALLLLPLLHVTAQKIDTAALIREQRAAVNTLIREQEFEAAATLCSQLAANEELPQAFRCEIGRRGVSLLRLQLKEPERALAELASLQQLPLTPAERGAVQSDILTVWLHSIRPRDIDLCEELALAIINDEELPFDQRSATVVTLVDFCYSGSAAQRERSLALGLDYLEQKLNVGQEARLRFLVSRTLTLLGRTDEAHTQTATIFATTNAPTHNRLTAGTALAQPLIDKGDFIFAEALLRQMLEFKPLNENQVAQILEQVGNLSILQNRTEAALRVYPEAYRLQHQRCLGACSSRR